MSDRGMKKYVPFKSLVAQSECLEQLRYKRNKIEKPKISSDKAEELNEILQNVNPDYLYELTYFYDGYLYKLTANILGIDTINKKLNTDKGSLYLYDVLNIVRLD